MAFVGTFRFSDALQQVVVAGGVVAEIVGLIDNDKVVIRWGVIVVAVDYFVQTAVAHKTAVLVFDVEILESLHPVVTHCRRKNHKDAGAVAVLCYEALCNHGSHHGFAQAHHIGYKTAAMPHHNVVALHHGVALIRQVVVAVGQHGHKIVLHLIAEMVDKHTHIKHVRRGLFAFGCQMGAANHAVHICHGDGNTFSPETLKFLLAEMHVVVVFHSHVKLVARWFSKPKPLLADIRRTHNHPAVAVLGVVLWQTEIELCVKVFGGVDTHLQPT